MAGSGQRARGEASGGMRIDDHKFWAGGKPEGSVFPNEAKMMKVESAEGAGSAMKYEDTNDRIVSAQREGARKAKAHQGRLPEYRN
jgi:hypothetical protein